MGDCKQRLETMEVMKAALEREKEDLEQQLSAEQMVCTCTFTFTCVLFAEISFSQKSLINFFPHS